MSPKAIPTAFFLLAGIAVMPAARAQSNNYTQTNLASNVPGVALTMDRDLLHPWGVATSANQPFRIALNGKGQFRSYDAAGNQRDPRAAIDVPPGGIVPPNPTGVAANTTGLFVPSTSLSTPFLFATRQGTISTEYADDRGDIKTTTILVIDHSSLGAEYTGLAVLAPDCCAPYLAVADFHRGFIETFTSFFAPLGIAGAFIDPNLPAGYAPWNLQVVGDKLFVAYALQDAAQHDPVAGDGNGIVDIYNLDGSFVRRFVSNGPLNVPSGIVQASANFGAFSNAILIGNAGDGVINAFDPASGDLLGKLKDGNTNVITNAHLHGMTFGDGTVGDANTLYLTSALPSGADGLFAAISVNTSGTGPNFNLNSDRQSAIVSPGQSATFSLTATPVANFRGAFVFTCNVPPAVTCTIGPPTVDVATGAATVTVTASAAATPSANTMAAFALPGVLLAGLGLRKRRSAWRFVMLAIGMLALAAAGATGCGGSGGVHMTPQPVPHSFSVAASAASVSRVTTLTLNVQ
ncbi:MAG TPA: TIGR03118 family protein [Acidobacteriaceae bacterium]|nr:TIGR03118 family protein [Acidobacteriaceae bacterium]